MNQLDITIDLETCSIYSNAAIMQISAIAWDRESTGKYPYLLNNSCREIFSIGVDLRDCFMLGMDFSKDTEDFWQKQSSAVKYSILSEEASCLHSALEKFTVWVDTLKKNYSTDKICIWSQGSDFDIPILKNAFKLCKMKYPFSYQSTRCARTYILEKGYSIYGSDKNVYEELPEYPEKEEVELKHNAVYDCLITTWNVWNLMKM